MFAKLMQDGVTAEYVFISQFQWCLEDHLNCIVAEDFLTDESTNTLLD